MSNCTRPCVTRPELFFPGTEEDEETVRGLRRTAAARAEAKALCATCPLFASCGPDARARGEEWGIWGDFDPEEERTQAHAKARREKRHAKEAAARACRLPFGQLTFDHIAAAS